jgi:adiponectin receptor
MRFTAAKGGENDCPNLNVGQAVRMMESAPNPEDCRASSGAASMRDQRHHLPTRMAYGLRSSDVPRWLRFDGIHTGYRYGGTYYNALLSLFVLHNECINAWTMLLGLVFSSCAFWFVVGTIQTSKTEQHVRETPLTAFAAFHASACLHVPFSVGYHLLMPLSKRVYNVWRKLDIMFIFIASVPLTYALSFFVFPRWATWALTATAASVAASAVKRVSRLKEGEPLHRSSHTRFIAMIAAVYYLPMACQGALDAASGSFSGVLLCVVCVPCALGLGGLAYVHNFPESAVPERLDLVVRLRLLKWRLT